MQRESILEVSDLGALPRGRAIVTGSGIPAGLLELVHFSQKSYGQDVKLSHDYYENVEKSLSKAPPSPRQRVEVIIYTQNQAIRNLGYSP